LTRLAGWEREFWMMLQEQKGGRSPKEKQAESLAGELEPTLEGSTR